MPKGPNEINNSDVFAASKINHANPERFQTLSQLIAVLVKNLFILPVGMNIGFVTILVPRIVGNDPNEAIVVTEEQVSWIGSSLAITMCIGSFGSSFISKPFGRRPVMIFMTIPFFLVCITFYFSDKTWHLFFGLCLSGLCGGLSTATVFSYVAEISQPHVRGMLAATSSLTTVFGASIEIIIGTFLPWRSAALVNSVIPIISFCLLWFLPESPYWLITKHKEDDARKSLAWFRGWTTTTSIEKEFQEINNHYQKQKVESEKFDKLTNLRNKLQLFSKKSFLYPLFLVSSLFLLSNFTGIVTLQTYSTLVFATLDVPINKYYATVLMGSCEFVGCLFSVFFVQCLGKRKMGLSSLFCVILCNLFLGLYTFLNDVKSLKLKADFENVSLEDISKNQWIPLFLLLCLSFSGYCGLRNLPWIVVSEVFSYDTRDIGCGISSAMYAVTRFLANKTFFNMIHSMTVFGIYWFHAIIGFIGFIFICLLLPETEGKSLQEISDHFAGGYELDNKVRRKGAVHPVTKVENA